MKLLSWNRLGTGLWFHSQIRHEAAQSREKELDCIIMEAGLVKVSGIQAAPPGRLSLRAESSSRCDVAFQPWLASPPPDEFAFDSRLSTVPSLQTLCRLVIQKSVVHRLAIDGLHLPKGLKDFCKYE